MTLKHKNSSRWAKRILSRGLDAQDEGTRAAIADQLHQHATLTRKMNTLNDSSSSSDESSDEDYSDEQSMDENYSGASKLLERAKEKTLKALEDGDEAPESGLLALPFMVINARYSVRSFKINELYEIFRYNDSIYTNFYFEKQ